MPRWEPNAVGRLHDAAIELFTEQGYDQTTVAQIAERAGLTERTFFNHFANKRDVLFGRTSELHKQVVAREVAACPAGTPPLQTVLHGLQAAGDEVLEELRIPAARRREIVDATPELREREEAKRAALTAAIAAALRERGLDGDAALLTAGTGLLIQQTAEQRWVQPSEKRPLRELLAEALSSLRTVLGTAAG
ncbi:TetR family transcriptional regulator [Streptomyces sp. SID8361]|uniref:TetR/AcrR family transcriptional regulator n=1 Tax=Streptomyces sp. MnatMP-M27 TaxID=1839768 RepID=UPI00081DA899|nr:TetR/AcrR family transcriptional regulator [Streptomyces sp. MnatMP-M27]MYU10137.1 TetR family transcriptional regulator [Streptomyces sp. SID8361]SCF68679.1 transcriptional regulator, TetR family [Streptomyces sp. MnatMP-M27]